MANKKILLIEPGYKNKYPPLGLMKIAAYHNQYGKKDKITFIKGIENKSVFYTNWDRVYITTLFSFEWKEISRTIDFAVKLVNGHTNKLFVGGIAASLMHSEFVAEPRWRGIRFINGLLGESPAKSLQLDEYEEEFYADDINGTPIEDLVPDYSILEQIKEDYTYPVHDAYFAYASRGCVRKCHFCGVPKLEGSQRDSQSITAVVNNIIERYGPKKDLMLMDNNVVASDNYKNIIAEIRDLGFQRGATFINPLTGKNIKRRVDFNQGVDARILCKDSMYLKEMSTIAIKPLRIAFDHIGVKKPYETAVRMAHDVGLDELSNYMLFNFKDTPEDLYQRMRLNVDLNVELGTKIFSFPMRYQPTDMKDRSYVGDHWHKYWLRSMQVILQATHGIVSGSPDYFKIAFGETEEGFLDLLCLPQHFLFNRSWYEEYDGKSELSEFKKLFYKLTVDERSELINLLSNSSPQYFSGLIGSSSSAKINSILSFYVPLSDENERKIWTEMKNKKTLKDFVEIPEDELVEDAGLSEVIK